MIAFIIGNGVSRKPIDLHQLKGKGTIFGCNALYRDFNDYDYLVAIDSLIIGELNNEANDERLIIPPKKEQWELNGSGKRSNAGMNAMLEAIRRNHNKLYCLGFDFLVRDDISTDNMYKNTFAYGPITHASQSDNFNRTRYLEWFASDNKEISFTFVLPSNNKYYSLNAPNITGMGVDKFIEKVASL